MPNRHRGEIEAEISGARPLALEELEAAFGADDLVALAERFSGGRLKARDLVRVIGAGLRELSLSQPESLETSLRARSSTLLRRNGRVPNRS